MALDAFIITLIAMAPAYWISRHYAGVQWGFVAYLAGFGPLAVAVVIMISGSGDVKDGPHLLAERLAYCAGRGILATGAAVFAWPPGAAVISFTQGLGESSDAEIKLTPNDASGASRRAYEDAIFIGNFDDVLGTAADSALILPLVGIWWGRGKRLDNAKRALETPDKTV